MSSVSIKYSALEDAAEEASTASKKLKSYAKEIDEAITKMQSLPGTDSSGYVNSALTLAKQKREEANQQAERYSKLSTRITTFKNYAKQQDTSGVNAISRSVIDYVGEQSFWEKVGNAIHDAYVGFLDKVENLGPIGKLLAQGIRKGVTGLGHLKQDVVNLFKYGEGKYWLNIGKAVLAIAGAVATAIGAVAAIVGGPVILVVLGVIGAVTGIAYMFLEMDDQTTTIEENIKAIKLHKNGDLTAARYYGNIDGNKEKSLRYDYGDAEDNAREESKAATLDTIKNYSKAISKVCTVTTGVLSNGVVTDMNTGKESIDVGRAVKGTIYKNLRKGGFNSNNYQDGGFDASKGFGLSKLFPSKNTDIMTKYWEGSGFMKGIGVTLDGAKSINNIIDIGEGIDSLKTGGQSVFDTVDSVMDIAGNIPVVDSVTGDGWALLKNTHKIGTTTINIFSGNSITERASNAVKEWGVGSSPIKPQPFPSVTVGSIAAPIGKISTIFKRMPTIASSIASPFSQPVGAVKY